jgi:CheY-like chemotaxis protein
MKYLFLDDMRIPRLVFWANIDRDAPWEIVRSYQQAVDWVQKNGFPDVISFDHDLEDNHYDGDFSDGRTGYDFCKWLVEYDTNTKTMPDDFRFTIHSLNPVGAENIKQYLNNYISIKSRDRHETD